MMARSGVVVDRTLPVGSCSRSELTDSIVATVAGSRGYRPLHVGLDRLSFARSVRPTWATVTAIVTAPTIVGLLFLLVRTTETFTCVIREDHTGIHARIHGRVHPALLRDLDALAGDRPSATSATTATVAAPSAVAPGPVGSMATGSPLSGAAPVSFAGPLNAPIVTPPPPPPPAPHGAVGGPSPFVASSAIGPPPSVGSPPPAVPPNDATRLVRPSNGAPARQAPGSLMRLRLEDGRSVDVAGFALLGRNPSASDADPEASLIVIDHDSVSKTHLAVGINDGMAWVADRHSTNGSAVVDLDGAEVALVPGERVQIHEGSAVRLGAFWTQVERVG